MAITVETADMKPVLLLASLLFTGSALAFHCPADMKKIDDALAAKPALSADKLAEGEVLHKAGKHQESVDTLAKAMAMLGLNKS